MIKKIVFIVFFISSFQCYSQRFKKIEGEFENLSNISSYRIEFNYENIQVHGFDSEEEFLKEKMKKRNADPAKAEAFKNDWFLNREKYYNPAFINYFNSFFRDGECKIDANSNYLMKVNLTWIYPGYAIEPAKISATIEFIDLSNSKTLLKVHFDKVIGFEKNVVIVVNEYERVIGAYEKLAKNLGIQLKRVL